MLARSLPCLPALPFCPCCPATCRASARGDIGPGTSRSGSACKRRSVVHMPLIAEFPSLAQWVAFDYGGRWAASLNDGMLRDGVFVSAHGHTAGSLQMASVLLFADPTTSDASRKPAPAKTGRVDLGGGAWHQPGLPSETTGSSELWMHASEAGGLVMRFGVLDGDWGGPT